MTNEILSEIEVRALNIPIDITALCIASGVAPSTVSRWRSGKKPRAQTLNKLYRKLDELEALNG
jgi:transcriptional regulator with XRE-family HTH domain